MKKGRKLGYHVPTEIFDDLFTALAINNKELARLCRVSESLVVHWKKRNSVEPHRLSRWIELLLQTKDIKSSEREEAKERVLEFLSQFFVSPIQSATPLDQRSSLCLSAHELRVPIRLDLSGVPDKQLIDELGRRGWPISKLLTEVVDEKEKG